jgi:hemoglobin
VPADDDEATTFYDGVGGRQFFVALVDRFYAGVESEPVLRPLYPRDLIGSRRDLTEFLCQYWGGPSDYSQRKGHPRLRMRHARFAVGPEQRDAWLAAMGAAVGAADATSEQKDELLAYFEMAATHMINV